jgi:hypothetical protein
MHAIILTKSILGGGGFTGAQVVPAAGDDEVVDGAIAEAADALRVSSDVRIQVSTRAHTICKCTFINTYMNACVCVCVCVCLCV